jgi:hypothetical protein
MIQKNNYWLLLVLLAGLTPLAFDVWRPDPKTICVYEQELMLPQDSHIISPKPSFHRLFTLKVLSGNHCPESSGELQELRVKETLLREFIGTLDNYNKAEHLYRLLEKTKGKEMK